MPAMNTLAVYDGKATPEAHNFEPLTTNGQKAVFVNRSSGIPAAYERLEIQVVEPKSATGAYRVIGSLTRPVLQTVNGVPTVVRSSKMNFDVNMPQASSLDERMDDVSLLSNLLADASVVSAVTKIEPFY